MFLRYGSWLHLKVTIKHLKISVNYNIIVKNISYFISEKSLF